MKISSARFGELIVDKNDIIRFQEGILGFEQKTEYFIVDPGDSTLILWLQSVSDGDLAFPLLEPKVFAPDYVVNLSPSEFDSLGLSNLSEAKIFSILTIPKNATQMTANLKAPIVINPASKIGRQIILQDSKLSVKHEMYKELKKYIVSYSSDDTKRTTIQETSSTSPTVDTNGGTEVPAQNQQKSTRRPTVDSH